jgi:hypothetical protein
VVLVDGIGRTTVTSITEHLESVAIELSKLVVTTLPQYLPLGISMFGVMEYEPIGRFPLGPPVLLIGPIAGELHVPLKLDPRGIFKIPVVILRTIFAPISQVPEKAGRGLVVIGGRTRVTKVGSTTGVTRIVTGIGRELLPEFPGTTPSLAVYVKLILVVEVLL